MHGVVSPVESLESTDVQSRERKQTRHPCSNAERLVADPPVPDRRLEHPRRHDHVGEGPRVLDRPTVGEYRGEGKLYPVRCISRTRVICIPRGVPRPQENLVRGVCDADQSKRPPHGNVQLATVEERMGEDHGLLVPRVRRKVYEAHARGTTGDWLAGQQPRDPRSHNVACCL